MAKKTAKLGILFYKAALSPFFGGACRFHPTCSDYCLEAFDKKNFFEALKVSALRLFRCRPRGPYGFDPLE